MTTCFIRSGRIHKPESEFQSTVIQYLQIRYGARIWTLNHRGGIGQRAGVPDLLCCIRGRFLALEIKSPSGKGRLGPRQKLELEAIRQAGGKAAVVASFEDLEEALRDFEGDLKLNGMSDPEEASLGPDPGLALSRNSSPLRAGYPTKGGHR